jgi:hypothetical protein
MQHLMTPEADEPVPAEISDELAMQMTDTGRLICGLIELDAGQSHGLEEVLAALRGPQVEIMEEIP